MSIFEDKRHNDPAYVGQKPIRTMQVPSESRDFTSRIINHAVEQDMNVRHVPNAGSDK